LFALGTGADPGWWRVPGRGIPAMGIVLSIICLERRLPRPATGPFWGFFYLLGNASYSVYLSHLYAVRGLTNLWDRLGALRTAPGMGIAFLTVCFSFGIAAGIITHWLIEKPATRAARTLLRRRGGSALQGVS
jgi:peptidoglycan/LPS O-acetylase OafA/YrhL